MSRPAMRHADARVRAPRVAAGVAVLAALGLMLAPATLAADPSASPAPNTPIEHLVVLMQENHTFDNYFGTYPGADGIPPDVCMPNDVADPTAGCVKSHHLTSHRTIDLNHGSEVATVVENGGKYNGFVYAQNRRNLPGKDSMGYYDGSDLPFYWNLASSYVLADRFFSSDVGGSRENHMFWVAGQSGGGQIPDKGYKFDTIFDRLQAAGVSWKFYVQNYDPTINYRSLTGDAQDSQTIWVPLVGFDRFIDNPELASHIVDIGQYHDDLAAGTLPAVAFMVPSGASEHPPGDVSIGQVYGASQVTALLQSTSWPTSAFVVTWDDWGGWYDHVVPPKVDSNGYGLRVPALIVSPYSTPGRIDSTTYDFTSILRFIEDNWDLQPLTARDAAANSIAAAFDFASPPRPPRIPAPVYPAEVRESPSARLALMAVYGLIVVVVPAGSVIAWRRRPVRPSAAPAYAAEHATGAVPADVAAVVAGLAGATATAGVGASGTGRRSRLLRTMPITAPPPVPARPRTAAEEQSIVRPGRAPIVVPLAATADVAEGPATQPTPVPARAAPQRRRVTPTKVVAAGSPSDTAASRRPTRGTRTEPPAEVTAPVRRGRRSAGAPAPAAPATPAATTAPTPTPASGRRARRPSAGSSAAPTPTAPTPAAETSMKRKIATGVAAATTRRAGGRGRTPAVPPATEPSHAPAGSGSSRAAAASTVAPEHAASAAPKGRTKRSTTTAGVSATAAIRPARSAGRGKEQSDVGTVLPPKHGKPIAAAKESRKAAVPVAPPPPAAAATRRRASAGRAGGVPTAEPSTPKGGRATPDSPGASSRAPASDPAGRPEPQRASRRRTAPRPSPAADEAAPAAATPSPAPAPVPTPTPARRRSTRIGPSAMLSPGLDADPAATPESVPRKSRRSGVSPSTPDTTAPNVRRRRAPRSPEDSN